MNPLISVIVPNFNHASFLEKRLDSIFSQSYSNFEVILLDDCSNDNSQKILSEYAKNPKVSQCVFNEINSGNTFVQWQRGMQLAKGDFIWIAESDDYCEPNFIEKLIEPLIEDERIVLSYSQSNKVNEFNEITGSWFDHTLSLSNSAFSEKFVIDGDLFIEKFLIHKNVIPNASAVIFRSKNILEEYITLDTELRYCADWIFYFKIILNNKVAFTPEKLNHFRYHNGSVIAKALKVNDKIELLKVDILMRSNIIEFLRDKKPSNSFNIVSVNSKIVEEINYRKILLLFQNKQYFRWLGYHIIFPHIIFKKNKFLRRLKNKIVYILKF